MAEAEAIIEGEGATETTEAPEPAVIAQAEAIVEEVTGALEAAEPAEQETPTEVFVEDIDEDSILEELMREEELLNESKEEEALSDESAEVGISVADLDTFTLDNVPVWTTTMRKRTQRKSRPISVNFLC